MTILVVGSGEHGALVNMIGATGGLDGEVLEQYAGEIDALVGHVHQRPDITMVVFNHHLAQFRTEENIRFFTSAAATATKHGCVVVTGEDARLDGILKHAARCLDLSLTKEQRSGSDVYTLKMLDQMSTTNTATVSLLAAWFGDRLGRLVSANEILASAFTAHFERRGLSLVRIGHCETRTLGYGNYFSRQDLQKTIEIQWGSKPIDEDALRALPAQMLGAVKNADFIGMQAPNSRIVSKNAILENASYVVARDLRAFPVGARYTSANVHLAIDKSPLLFELLREAHRVWLITGRDVAPALQKHIGRDVRSIQIPAEHKFANQVAAEPHFTTIFDRAKEQIRNEVQAGDVVLVGAGVLGKVYCSLAKDNGAVALDIGSVFDAWSGLKTRGNGFDIAPL